MRQTKPIRPFQFTYRRRRYMLQRGRPAPIAYFAFAGAHGLITTGLRAVLQRQPGLREHLLQRSDASGFRAALEAEILADASTHYSASPLLYALVEHALTTLSTRELRGLVRAAGTPRPRGNLATPVLSPSVFTDTTINGLLDDWVVPMITAQILHGKGETPDPEVGNCPLDTVIH